MQSQLIIVESPGKIKTIQKYLPKDYHVTSCYGHIRDLPKKELGIDIEQGFKPHYIPAPEKKKLLADLKAQAQKASLVWLASDDDREGEAIAWHLQEILQLPKEKTKRIVFRAITKSEIEGFEQRGRDIDLDLVKAQEARRILDRLVGYQLSPILWRKIKPGLSAGRVQSVAVRLIVEREREVQNFKSTTTYKITGQLHLEDTPLDVELAHNLANKEDAKALLEKCQKATFTIEDLQQKESIKNPPPPFTTSTLQQAASQTLGFSIKQTMVLAQKLYEQGAITYMRTDALRIAPEAQEKAKQVILQQYGPEYHTPRTYKTKSATVQEAHEAIRPTDHTKTEISKDTKLQKLYRLIHTRTIASQMSSAKFDKTTATIALSNDPTTLQAKGDLLTFPGYLAAQQNTTTKQKPLPPLQKGQTLTLGTLQAKETFSKAPPRYTEASLVKKLEDLGIGRPSTYAPTISTIQQRGYIEKETRPGIQRNYTRLTLTPQQLLEETLEETYGTEKNKLFPTSVATVVNDFLYQHCQEILDYQFTAHTETQLDKIATKQLNPQTMLQNFYSHFTQQVENATNADQKANKERLIGTDPATKKPVIARLSNRYGPLLQLGNIDDAEKPKFASLPAGRLLENITLEEALQQFELPKEIGTYEEAPITAHIGKYGPYLKHQNTFYSLKELDPHTIGLQEAITVIETKRQAPSGRLKIFTEDPTIEIHDGRYGPYIKTPKRNISIPKTIDPHTLTYAQAQELIKAAPAKRKRRPPNKKK